MLQEKINEKSTYEVSTRKNPNILNMVTCSLLIALVFIFTKFVQFPLPGSAGGGLVHMGNVMVFVAAIVFGPRKGFVAAAFGMALFDFLSPYASYTIITFIGKGSMAYIIGTFAYMSGKEGRSILFNSIGIIIGGIVMIAVYYIGEIFMLGSFISPIANVPGNITQIVIGFVLGMPLALILKRYSYFRNIHTV